MKKITLKKISINKFKGIDNLSFDFKEFTEIEGDNEKGKTSIIDAFQWCLFGKNSNGEEKFNIKPLSSNNEPILNTTPTVEVLLESEGKDILLRREHQEDWVNRRDEGNILKGYKTGCFIDNVSVSVTEYNRFIDELCPKNIFNLITNPEAFNSLHWQDQFAQLMGMVGNIEPEIKAELIPLWEEMGSYSIQTAQRMKDKIKARVSTTKEALGKVKNFLEENVRMTPQPLNWAEIEAELVNVESEIKRITEINTSALKAYDHLLSDYKSRKLTIEGYEDSLRKIEREQQDRFYKDYYEKLNAYNQTAAAISALQQELNVIVAKNEQIAKDRVSKSIQLEQLRNEYKEIKSKNFDFNGHTSCPMCGVPYLESRIEEEQKRSLEAFNESKVRQIEENIAKGKRLSQEINAMVEVDTSEIQSKIDALKAILIPVEKPEFVFTPTTESKKIEAEIKKLSTESLPEIKKEDTTELESRKRELLQSLSLKTNIEDMQKRNAELHKQEKDLLKELLSHTKAEADFEELNSTIMEYVEKKVAENFKVVKFKIFDKKQNGNIENTCIATINGVPYSDLNNAGKIIAGLDIINALVRYHKYSAPIFIDNIESITSIPAMESQVVTLRVVKNSNLIIK